MYQLPNNELHEAYWIYTHRFLLQKIGYAVAGITTGVIWIVFIFSFVVYVTGISSARRSQETLLDSQVLYRNRVVAQPLEVVDAGAASSNASTFDAYVLIKNPNQFYSARFSYSIVIDGQTISFADVQIMPRTEGYYIASNIAGTTLPSATKGTIDQTVWSRVHTASIGQLDFEVMNLTLEAVKVADTNLATNTNNTTNANINTATAPVSVVNSSSSDNSPDTSNFPYSKLSADLKNNAIIGFKTVRVVAIVKQNNTVVGIKELTLHDIASYSETPVEFYWQRRFTANSTSEILIQADYIDRANLIYPGE